MLGITCEKDCPDISWDFVNPQLQLAIILWSTFLGLGLSLAFYSISTDVDSLRERLEVRQGGVQSSKVYVTTYLVLALLQCCFFMFRTFSKSVDGISFILEVAACIMYLANSGLSWLVSSFKGFSSVCVFMFTFGLVDCVMFPSVICLMVVEVDGSKGWFSFSFVAALHILEAYRWMLDIRRISLQSFFAQTMDVSVNILFMVYFAGMMTMTLENLGDPSWLEKANEDKWNTVSSLYYVFCTISTVGYGDLAPVTGLGRMFAIVTIFGGVSGLVTSLYRVLKVLHLHTSGGGNFSPRISSRHIVVTGNPTVQMSKDFIGELFHKDHAEDADDLHLVFLVPRGSTTLTQINQEMRKRSNVHVAPRVHTYHGSVLETYDLRRVAPMQAAAVFILPNMQCKDYMHEDTENIIRMMAVLRVNPNVRMILLLMKAENEQLLHESGVANALNVTVLAMDQFKLELVGKTCQVPGFFSMICNLFKTIAETEEEDYDEVGRWLEDYDRGTGHEIYEVELSLTYSARGAVFSECVVDVLQQTEGLVYLIGIVETSVSLGSKRVIVNPGTWYPIKDPKTGVQTSGIFIASDRDSVHQCEGGLFLGQISKLDDNPTVKKQRVVKADWFTKREKRKREEAAAKKAAEMAASFADPNEDQIRRDPKLNAEMQKSARVLMRLAKQQHLAAHPARPPLKTLAKGGHVLFLCIGVHDSEELRLGAEHFLRPLRMDKSPAAIPIPVVVMAPAPPRDWQRVCGEQSVYYLKGSPLNLFDLEKANFRCASTIFVCHVGSPHAQLMEPWMVDSEVICCARLIESELPPAANISVITELAVDTNHPFVPLVTQKPPERNAMEMRHFTSRISESHPMDKFRSEHSRKSAAMSAHSSIQSLRPRFCVTCGNQFEDADAPLCKVCGNPRETTAPAFSISQQVDGRKITEYYRQPRYACGQLFVGNIITSLTVNTFFNPSLWELVHQMIKAEVIMVPVSREWEGKSYYEFFTQKLLQEDDLMGVAIYRRHEAGRRRQKGEAPVKQWSYVMTGPPAKETHMMRGDRVICFSSAFRIREEDLEMTEEAPAAEEEEEKKEEIEQPVPINTAGTTLEPQDDKAKTEKKKKERMTTMGKDKSHKSPKAKAKAGAPNSAARIMMMR